MNFSTSVVLPEHRDANVHTGPVVVGERLADQGLHRVHPGADLADILQLVAAVAEHELRLDLDEGLRREVLVRAVLRVLLVVVQLAVGAGPIAGDVRHQRVPREADVHVIARRRVASEPDGALETAFAEPRLDVVPDVLDAQAPPVDRLEQVRGELLVRGKRRPVRRGLGARLTRGGIATSARRDRLPDGLPRQRLARHWRTARRERWPRARARSRGRSQ